MKILLIYQGSTDIPERIQQYCNTNGQCIELEIVKDTQYILNPDSGKDYDIIMLDYPFIAIDLIIEVAKHYFVNSKVIIIRDNLDDYDKKVYKSERTSSMNVCSSVPQEIYECLYITHELPKLTVNFSLYGMDMDRLEKEINNVKARVENSTKRIK